MNPTEVLKIAKNNLEDVGQERIVELINSLADFQIYDKGGLSRYMSHVIDKAEKLLLAGLKNTRKGGR